MADIRQADLFGGKFNTLRGEQRLYIIGQGMSLRSIPYSIISICLLGNLTFTYLTLYIFPCVLMSPNIQSVQVSIANQHFSRQPTVEMIFRALLQMELA